LTRGNSELSAASGAFAWRASVVECASPLALWPNVRLVKHRAHSRWHENIAASGYYVHMSWQYKRRSSGGGPPQSRTLARWPQPAQSRSVVKCASPSAHAARQSAASARRRLALWPKTILANEGAHSQWHKRIAVLALLRSNLDYKL
jgi:hypothetical protein